MIGGEKTRCVGGKGFMVGLWWVVVGLWWVLVGCGGFVVDYVVFVW